MRLSIVSKLLKKELSDIIKDKKTIFAMIVLPLLLYPVLMIIMTFIFQGMNAEMNKDVTTVLVKGETPVTFQGFIDETEYENLEFIYEKDENIENEYTLIFKNNGSVEIEYDSSIEINGFSNGDFRDLLNDFSVYEMSTTLKNNDIQLDIIEQDEITFIDMASSTESMGVMIGQVLPMLLIMGVILGVISPAIDIISGEKERKTLETLVSLPVTSIEIATSKFITLVILGVVTSLLNIVSLAGSLWFLINGIVRSAENVFGDINFAQIIVPIIITSICFILFSGFVAAITMIVTSMANSYKEAQNYSSPLMIFLMLPSYATMMPIIELNVFTSFIPVINIALLVKEMFKFEPLGLEVGLVILSNVLFCTLAILILGKMFAKEEMLFKKSGGFKLLDGRNNLTRGGVPGITDAILVLVLGLMILVYGAGMILTATNDALLSTAISLILVALLAIIYCWYINTSFKQTFALRNFKLKYLLQGIVMMLVSLGIVILIQNLLLNFFPNLGETAELISNLMINESIVIQLLVFALCPAICEEILFRGFILHSLNVKNKPVVAIVLTSVLFGVYHMNLLQFITGLLLGSVLGYITYKSKSIYPAMILHFMNNTIAVFLSL